MKTIATVEVEQAIVWVDPGILVSSPRRGSFRSDEAMNDLQASMQAIGFSPAFPIVVTALDDGRLQIVQGHTRRDVAIKMGLQVAVVEVTAEKAIRIEIEGDRYTYGMFAGKAMEWIRIAFAERRAKGKEPDSKIAAQIAVDMGLDAKTVALLDAANQAMENKSVSPFILNFKRPVIAAKFFQRLDRLNRDLKDAGLPPVPVEVQSEWINHSRNTLDPYADFSTRMNVYQQAQLGPSVKDATRQIQSAVSFVVSLRRAQTADAATSLAEIQQYFAERGLTLIFK